VTRTVRINLMIFARFAQGAGKIEQHTASWASFTSIPKCFVHISSCCVAITQVPERPIAHDCTSLACQALTVYIAIIIRNIEFTRATESCAGVRTELPCRTQTSTRTRGSRESGYHSAKTLFALEGASDSIPVGICISGAENAGAGGCAGRNRTSLTFI